MPYNAWDDVSDDKDAGDTPDIKALSAEEIAVIDRRAARTLARTVVVQLSASGAVALAAWLVAGPMAGFSALVGAAACAIPNVLLALRLLFGMIGGGSASPATVLLGEFIKLVLTACLLGLAVKFGRDVLVWPALLVGLVVALKSYYWLLLFKDS
ncbi:hypothetical protein GCM10025795_11630 [Verticiella sediminum]